VKLATYIPPMEIPQWKVVLFFMGGRFYFGERQRWLMVNGQLPSVICGGAFGATFKKRLREAPPQITDNN